MKNVIKVGKLFNASQFQNLIYETKNLKTYIQKYNDEFKIYNDPCWITYENERNIEGSISITTHLYKIESIVSILDKIASILNHSYLGKVIHFKKSKINIVKTIGDVAVHKDQGDRMSALNIGLYNSNSAITKFGLNDNLQDFNYNNEKLVVEDSYGYIINTLAFHSVSAYGKDERYLITYNIKEPFENIKKIINQNVL